MEEERLLLEGFGVADLGGGGGDGDGEPLEWFFVKLLERTDKKS